MSDLFLPTPAELLVNLLTPQEAVDWLAFGSPRQQVRRHLSLDQQIHEAHSAAGVLLLSLWSDDLNAYVQSPSTSKWFRVPAAYWNPPRADDMASLIKAADIPQTLPGQPRPLDPRYEIVVPFYRHELPVPDLVWQIIAFRQIEIERHHTIAATASPRPAMRSSAAPISLVINRGVMPSSAKPNDFKHERYAHDAAEIVRRDKVLPQAAFRQVAPIDPVRTTGAIVRAIRGAYELMYERDGSPLPT